MNILFTGKGTGGSWAMRGEQLGAAMGATVLPKALDIAAFDAVVVVKRALPDLLFRARNAGVPLIYDIVDAWPQPYGNAWDRAQAMDWLRATMSFVRPAAIVAATKRMEADCEQFDLPVITVPHHARPYREPNPIRDTVGTVVYEGSPRHLGSWAGKLDAECSRRGWMFVTGGDLDLRHADIVVALREMQGYAPASWKSNVKLANAQASGTPCILNREAGYLETASGAECWADDMQELRDALELLADAHERRARAAVLRAAAPKLPDIATRYREWIEQVCETAGSC